jgi:glycosyltransferase involved in cell wall biosynthesis
MLDIEKMVRAGAESAGATKIILAAPYDLSPQVCRDLAQRGLISGYVASTCAGPLAADGLAVGEWIDRNNGSWRLQGIGPSTIVFLGSSQHLRTRMLFEARRAGVGRVLVVHVDGQISADIDVGATLLNRLTTALVQRLLSSRALARGGPRPLARMLDLSFERAFALMDELFRPHLRLPADAFVPGRVLIIAGSLGPGGAERQVAYTAAGLMKSKRYEVFVGCNYLDPPADFFKSYVLDAGAQVLQVPYDAPEFRTPEIGALREKLVPYDPVGLQNLTFAVFHYALLIRSVRPSLVHTWMDYCNVLAGLAADLVGVPALIQGGRSVAPDNFAIFQPYMRPGYLALSRKRPTIFLNNSQAGAKDYARWLGLPAERFRVVNNGFDFPPRVAKAEREAERRQHNIAQDAIVVGSIIRFSEEKRPKLLIDMAELLLQQHTKLRFIFFGAGPMIEDVRADVAARGLASAIQLPGFTKNAWSALAAMDIFVLTSRMEGLPNVLIEAQASGLPVVCTAVGGMTETYVEGETGFGVPTATPERLSEAVSRLVRDGKLRRRMADAAFRHARQTFDIERMVSQTLKIYQEAEQVSTTTRKPVAAGAH